MFTTFIIFHGIVTFYPEQDKSAEHFENIFIIVMNKNLVLDLYIRIKYTLYF